jgi:hypothetical protein
MYRRPLKFQLTCPKKLLFFDETGFITNQKDDGYNGKELLALPTDGSKFGVVGSTSDICFSKFCFASATGDPVLCAIILKSNCDIKDIPISWGLGIYVRIL